MLARIWVVLVALLGAAGCASFGPVSVDRDRFDQAIADFAAAYADHAERDHKVLEKAVRDGRLKVENLKED